MIYEQNENTNKEIEIMKRNPTTLLELLESTLIIMKKPNQTKPSLEGFQQHT